LEERKEPRAHSFNVKRQGGWFSACLGIGLAFLTIDSLATKILGLAVIAIGVFGAMKFQDGLGYRIALIIFRSLRFRAKSKGVTSLETLTATDKAPIGISVMSYPATDDEGRSFRLGVFYNPEDNCDTFIVTGSGIAHPGADPFEIMRQEDQYIDGIAEVLSNFDGRVGVALPYLSRPVNQLRQELWDGLNIDPDVIEAKVFDSAVDFDYDNATIEERQATALMQSRVGSELYEADVIRAVAMTVPRPITWPKVKGGLLDGKLTPEQLEEAPVVKLALLLENELRSRGIEDAAILDRIDIAKYVRVSWDMIGIQDWFVQLEMSDPINNPDEIRKGLNEWPTHEMVSKKSRRAGDYLQTDGTYHRVLQAKSFTITQANIGEFDECFGVHELGYPGEVGLAITLCGDSINPDTERGILKRQSTLQIAFRGTRKGEYNESEEDIDRFGQKRRKETAYYRSKTIGLSFNVFFVVSAVNLKLLDVATETVIRRAKRHHIKVRRIKWEMRQVRALFSALLGVSMFN